MDPRLLFRLNQLQKRQSLSFILIAKEMMEWNDVTPALTGAKIIDASRPNDVSPSSGMERWTVMACTTHTPMKNIATWIGALNKGVDKAVDDEDVIVGVGVTPTVEVWCNGDMDLWRTG
jgi:hypothetical protein